MLSSDWNFGGLKTYAIVNCEDNDTILNNRY